MARQSSWSERQTVNLCQRWFESSTGRHGKPGSLAKNRLGNTDARVLWLISGAKPSGNNSTPRRRLKGQRCLRPVGETMREEMANLAEQVPLSYQSNSESRKTQSTGFLSIHIRRSNVIVRVWFDSSGVRVQLSGAPGGNINYYLKLFCGDKIAPLTT